MELDASPNSFASFLDANETLVTAEIQRYLDPLETMQKVREAIVDQRQPCRPAYPL